MAENPNDVTEREKLARAAAKTRAPSLAGFISEESVRDFMVSDSVELTAMGTDLQFSSKEIVLAMEMAARRFNGIPPYSMRADPSQLPADTNIFFDAIAAELYALEYRKLSRQDIDYTAGRVGVNLAAKRLAHVEKLRQQHAQDFTTAARDIKRIKNVMGFFGRF